MKEKPVLKPDLELRSDRRYRIQTALDPRALAKVQGSENPKGTLCELLGITGYHPGQSDGIWVQEVKNELYLRWKPHTGWNSGTY